MNILHKAGGVVGIGDKKEKEKDEHDDLKVEGAGEITDEPKKKKNKEEADVAVQMASGDYLIHIYIEEAKQLDIDDSNRAEVLCGVSMTGFDLPTTFSTSKEDVTRDSELNWSEHLFIQTGKQDKEKV